MKNTFTQFFRKGTAFFLYMQQAKPESPKKIQSCFTSFAGMPATTA